VALWYRRFVPDLVRVVKPLNDLVHKGIKYVWAQDHQQAFEDVKARLVSELVLECLDFERTFTLQPKASDCCR